jgi:hypothetical protein
MRLAANGATAAMKCRAVDPIHTLKVLPALITKALLCTPTTIYPFQAVSDKFYESVHGLFLVKQQNLFLIFSRVRVTLDGVFGSIVVLLTT